MAGKYKTKYIYIQNINAFKHYLKKNKKVLTVETFLQRFDGTALFCSQTTTFGV